MALVTFSIANAIPTFCKKPLLGLNPLEKRPAFRSNPTTCCTAAVCNTLVVPGFKVPNLLTSHSSFRSTSSFFVDPMLVKLRSKISQAKRTDGQGGALSSSCSVVLSTETLRWVFSTSAVLLMLLRNTSINKAFLVPLLALQAPREVIGWIRGDYGLWAAFLALLVRLFYYIPGELELPLFFVLLIITSPYQALDFRGTPAAIILCAAIAAYLAFQHFSRAWGLQGAFREGAFLASVAIICLACIPIIFFVQSF